MPADNINKNRSLLVTAKEGQESERGEATKMLFVEQKGHWGENSKHHSVLLLTVVIEALIEMDKEKPMIVAQEVN